MNLEKIRTFIHKNISDNPYGVLVFCAGAFMMMSFGENGINLDSATYAVVARNMAEFGSWLSPHYTEFYLIKFAEHPPLAMWAQGLIFLIVEPNDTTARLFGAVTAIGCVLTVFSIGRAIKDRYFGFVCGLILLLTYNFMQISNSTLLDTPMTFFILLAIFGILKMHKENVSAMWSVITGASLGFAWLTKAIVAGPGGLAVIIFVIIWRRDWLKQKLFWLLPLTALALIFGHLAIDYYATGGNFFSHYLKRQIIGRLNNPSTELSVDYMQSFKKYVVLYLPFIVLIPVGIFRIIRSKVKDLYPILIAFVLYLVFYSLTPFILYHYFVPIYALSAPIAAMAFFNHVSAKRIQILTLVVATIFFVASLAIGKLDVKMQHIRTPEIYSLNDKMDHLLNDSSTRYGVTIGSEKNWDWIAKTSWYWRSDLLYVSSIDKAVTRLKSDKFAYLLSDKKMSSVNDSLSNYHSNDIKRELENDRLIIFVSAESSDDD